MARRVEGFRVVQNHFEGPGAVDDSYERQSRVLRVDVAEHAFHDAMVDDRPKHMPDVLVVLLESVPRGLFARHLALYLQQ